MVSLFAFLHHVAAFTLTAALAIEFVLIKGALSVESARRLQLTDMVFGASDTSAPDHAFNRSCQPPCKSSRH
ncbi:MAG TPA: DUF2214 family protein [Casimicrobiaceae bacterium]|jgi:uncharacterized membrane protein